MPYATNDLELLAIYDEQLRYLGIAERGEVHKKGYWHKTFHCWVLCKGDASTGSSSDAGAGAGAHLVLQERHANKDTNAGKLDVSCAGHLSAGETISDGVRELKEELGITVAFADLQPLGTIREAFQVGALRDFEVAHVYLLPSSLPLSAFRPALDEVSGLFLVSVQQFRAFVYEEVPQLELRGLSYAGCEGEVGSGVYQSYTAKETKRTFRLTDLVKRPVDYYELLFAAL